MAEKYSFGALPPDPPTQRKPPWKKVVGGLVSLLVGAIVAAGPEESLEWILSVLGLQ